MVFEPIDLWEQLHDIPECSGREMRTSGMLREAMTRVRPDGIIYPLSGYSFACVTGPPEKRLLIRSDMDAVPGPGGRAAHLCGHDGHAALLVYTASLLAGERRGFIFLFQGEEETGQGARKAVKSLAEKKITYTAALGFHNIPGYPLGTALVKGGCFAQASVGFSLHIRGETSHASEPHKARNPALLLAELIREIPGLPSRSGIAPAMATVVYARLGEKAFGVTPGDASLFVTLRSPSDTLLEEMKREVTLFCLQKARSAGFPASVQWQEFFPAVKNHEVMTRKAEEGFSSSRLPYISLHDPFPWSEDFGWFSGEVPALMTGIGSGESQPPLHHPDYEFPRELIRKGARVLAFLARTL